jgi:hypothetical protein
MTLYLPHKAQQVENRWLSPLLPSSLASVSLIVTVASVSLAAAAECQVTEKGGMIQEMLTWKGSTSSMLPLIHHRGAGYLRGTCTVSSARGCTVYE